MPTFDRLPRLHRLAHIFAGCPLYFLTFCTHQRASLLSNDFIHIALIDFFRAAKDRGIYVGRYVLMPDHAHLFVSVGAAGPALSVWIKSLKNYLSKTLRQNGQPAPHWQKGFFDHVSVPRIPIRRNGNTSAPTRFAPVSSPLM